MSYHLLTYIILFLPMVICVYQLVPSRGRWLVILAADYIFFYMISGKLIIYLLAATLIAYFTGMFLDYISRNSKCKGKELVRKKRLILGFGIVVNIAALLSLKYLGMLGLTLLAPIGISYYTLMIISYMTDVYRGTAKFDKNIAKVALYLSFFPQIMEGPISRYNETAESLYSGKDIEFNNLVFGYQRIMWGLFKKMLIADRLAPMVSKIFGNYENYDGTAIMIAVIGFTLQLYMEFSGCMDIIMGSGEIFGVKLPENFRQPFFAKSASDFWHRWHITLGTWLKDYVFYPVSLAKPIKKISKKVKKKMGIGVSKFVAPSIALFLVWLCNGIWHGPKWTFVFYGMYYFVLIFIENITAAPMKKLTDRLHINTDGKAYKVYQGLKLFIIINIGELFFRADSVGTGFGMLSRIFTNFHVSAIFETNFGVDAYDMILALMGIAIVLIVDVIHEKNISIRERILSLSLPIRWGFWYAMIVFVVVFGAYGAGYTMVDMIYAAY